MKIPISLRRQILRLHYVQRYSCERIDSELGLPRGLALEVVQKSMDIENKPDWT